jgi:uncharacterized protein (DUF1501 family)
MQRSEAMAISRRQFIKRSAGVAGVSILLPEIFLRKGRAQSAPDAKRRILVVVQFDGGNDGLNTVIPYTDASYYSLRPRLGFKESELKDAQGRSTIISDKLGLHPYLNGVKELYDAGQVAIVLGAGEHTLTPSLSHFAAKDIWQTATLNGLIQGEGWLGRYASAAFGGQVGLHSLAAGAVPRSLLSNRVTTTRLNSFDSYLLRADPAFPANINNQIEAIQSFSSNAYSPGSLLDEIAGTGLEALETVTRLKTAPATYRSTVAYPSGPAGQSLKMIAQVILAVPEASLFHLTLGSFDHHSGQITSETNKLEGPHARNLKDFSDSVKAFYNDMAEHGLVDDVTLMTWTEFGRRPQENASLGTDHGTSSVMFVIGKPVRGGLYGEQPQLTSTALDSGGNLRVHVDFRSVYATILDHWLNADSTDILGRRFEDLGFFG